MLSIIQRLYNFLSQLDELFKKTGIHPTDVHVVELHDCFAANELITYEALGLCPPGRVVFIDKMNYMYEYSLPKKV